jgi:hypothetical protein
MCRTLINADFCLPYLRNLRLSASNALMMGEREVRQDVQDAD